jgi:hypothetical protein
MAFTEFYCQSGGSNLNAGSTTNNAAAYTSTNGNWSTTTHIFIPTDGSTPASTVNVGDFASIYVDGATLAVYIVRVTAVAAGVNGGITTSATAFAGTAPTTSATARTIKVGGAWLGPNAAIGFPVNLSNLKTLQNAAGNLCRINFKNNQTYTISALINGASNQFIMQGYGSSPGDGGKATIDGSTNAIQLLNMTGQATLVADLIFVSTATTGAVTLCGDTNSTLWFRCIFHGSRGNGLQLGNTVSAAIECEAYDNNKSNTAGNGGFALQLSGASCYRCISHDNTGSNTAGFVLTAGAGILDHCIADTNGGKGINIPGGANPSRVVISACDIYNNGSDGIAIATSTATMAFFIENTNLIKNAGAGINVTSALGTYYGHIFNVGYGSGTQANGSADAIGGLEQSGSVTYASGVTPWTDPANGDFRISLGAAISTGRGAFLQTQAGYAGTVGYPDIGAAAAQDLGKVTASNTQAWPDGFVGQAFVFNVVANYTFTASIVSGALPPGLSLTQPDGFTWRVSGTPTTTGTYTFTLRIQLAGSYGDGACQIIIRADPDQGAGGVGGG